MVGDIRIDLPFLDVLSEHSNRVSRLNLTIITHFIHIYSTQYWISLLQMLNSTHSTLPCCTVNSVNAVLLVHVETDLTLPPLLVTHITCILSAHCLMPCSMEFFIIHILCMHLLPLSLVWSAGYIFLMHYSLDTNTECCICRVFHPEIISSASLY